MKEGRVRRRRFFVLTENNQLQYFKSEDPRQPIVGNIPLDTLCAIDSYDEEDVKSKGEPDVLCQRSPFMYREQEDTRSDCTAERLRTS